MTSVKQFRVEREPTADRLGAGAFVFTDAYSVFDWGKMPDAIPGKGASLCAMGASTFEALEAADVATHYQGVVSEGSVVSLDDATEGPREMAIELTQVPDLPRVESRSSYDYEAFHDTAGENYLVPLEIVFRNTVPVGSSLRRRATPAEVGIESEKNAASSGSDADGGEGEMWPDETVELPEPVVEFSTKFEESDRYLDRAEAARVAGAADLDGLEALAREVNRVVTERATAAGFTHHDGKIECLYHRGDLRVADVAGTFDENRFSYGGQQVSKEVLRQHHKRTQPEWVTALDEAKARAEREQVADWRSLCDREPEPLSEGVVRTASDLYAAGANAYTDRDLFDAPEIEAAVAAVRDLAE